MQKIAKSTNTIVGTLLDQYLFEGRPTSDDEIINVKGLILNNLESEQFVRLHLDSCSISIGSFKRECQHLKLNLSENLACHGYYLQYTIAIIVKGSGIAIRLSAPLHDRCGTVKIFINPNMSIEGLSVSTTSPNFRNLVADSLAHLINLPACPEIISINHELHYQPMWNVNPFPAYATVFKSLLGRELTKEEFDIHFSNKAFNTYMQSIINSEEFVQTRVFEPLYRSGLCRLENLKDLDICMPSFLDYSIFTCLTIRISGVESLLLIPTQLDESFFLDRESLHSPVSSYTPVHADDYAAHNLFLYLNRSSEILNELVNQTLPSCRCNLDILARLQKYYAIPGLETIFEQCDDVIISLVTCQWIELKITHGIGGKKTKVVLATPE